MRHVTVERDDWTPWYERTKAELAQLAQAEIHVGILSSAGGELLKIVRWGNPLGYLVCLREGKTLYIKELMCPAEERAPAAGAFARSRGLPHIAAFGPAEQGGKPRGMLWRAEGFEAPGKNLPYIGCMLD